MMSRRAVALFLALGMLAAPIAAEAQPAARVQRIGVLVSGSREPTLHLVKALEEGLRDLGYVEGRNIAIEYRFAEGKLERLPELAAEFVRLKVDIITPFSTLAAISAKHATTTIPIAMVSPTDPVSAGLVASLAHPGRWLECGTSFELSSRIWPYVLVRSRLRGGLVSQRIEWISETWWLEHGLAFLRTY